MEAHVTLTEELVHHIDQKFNEGITDLTNDQFQLRSNTNKWRNYGTNNNILVLYQPKGGKSVKEEDTKIRVDNAIDKDIIIPPMAMTMFSKQDIVKYGIEYSSYQYPNREFDEYDKEKKCPILNKYQQFIR